MENPVSNIGGGLDIPAPEVVALPTSNEGSVVEQTTSTTPLPVTVQPDSPDNDVGFDELVNAVNGDLIPEPPKPKVEVVDPKIAQQAAITASKTTTSPTKPLERDYSCFDQKDIPSLKKMSNDAFSIVRTIALESAKRAEQLPKLQEEVAKLRAGKVPIPETIYEHPQGYVLTPEYAEATKSLNEVAGVEAHWQSQFAKMRRGEDWNALARDGNGNIVVDKTPRKADAESEAWLQSTLTTTAQEKYRRQQAVTSVEHSWKDVHSKGVAELAAANEKYFKHCESEEVKPLVAEIEGMINPQFKRNPMYRLTVNALATVKALQIINQTNQQKAQQEATKTASLTQATRNAGPTEGGVAGGGSKAPPVVSGEDFNDFSKLLNEEAY